MMAQLKKTIKSWVRRMLPWAVQRRLYRWYANHYIDCLSVTVTPDRPTVLFLNHFFDQDLRALTMANSGYNLVIIDAVRLFLGAKIFFSGDVFWLRAPYASADPVRVEQYRCECRMLLERLQRRFKIDLILATSDVFYWIREFIVVAKESQIPFAVMDKEGTVSPYALEAHAARIRNLAPFMSDHIFVWSERQRLFWSNVGVDDSKITVVGQARSDLFFAEKRDDVDKLFDSSQPLITCFSIDNGAYIPPEQAARGVSWETLKRETMEELASLASENPDYNFVVKTHPQQLDLAHLRERYQRDNLRVVGGAKIANELIQRSELIIAFQTTAVIEAMLLKRRVIYTAWDENYNRFLLDDLLPFHKAPGIVVAQSREQFGEVCRRFFAGDYSDFEFSKEDDEARDRFVNQYLYRPDGHVCERFYAELDKFLSETAV